jgi:hypothetical protein
MSRILQPFKGAAFTRAVIAQALKALERTGVSEPEIAAARWGEASLAAKLISNGGFSQAAMAKAAIIAGTTRPGNWTELLAETDVAATEFWALVREQSLIGRIAGLRRVPLRTRLIGVTTGFAAAWTAEGDAVAISKAVFAEQSLPRLKVSSLAVVTEELLTSADPAAEMLIRDELVAAVVRAIDATFINAGNAGVAGVKPAGVANGTSGSAATIEELIGNFPGNLETAVLIGSPERFVALHSAAHPDIGARGGELLGIPAVASTAAGDTITLLDPTGVAYGEDATAMEVKVSRQATIEMRDDPTGDAAAPTAAQMVSLFQTNAAGILFNGYANWQRVRPCASTFTPA